MRKESPCFHLRRTVFFSESQLSSTMHNYGEIISEERKITVSEACNPATIIDSLAIHALNIAEQ